MVFPASAGVILIFRHRKVDAESFPPTCGGDPELYKYFK